MTIKTTGNGCITTYSTMASALFQNDPFQHRGNQSAKKTSMYVDAHCNTHQELGSYPYSADYDMVDLSADSSYTFA